MKPENAIIIKSASLMIVHGQHFKREIAAVRPDYGCECLE